MLKRLSLAGVLLLCACGGGGGGDSFHVNLSPDPLTASPYVWDIPTTLQVNATVEGSAPSSTLLVAIVDSANTFQAGHIGIGQTGPTSFVASLPTQANLTAGTYSGTLDVKVCGAPSCSPVYSDQSLPYTLTVKPNPTVTLSASPAVLAVQAVTGNASTGSVGSFAEPMFTLQGAPIYPVYVKVSDPTSPVQINDPFTFGGDAFGPINSAQFQLSLSVQSNQPPGELTGTVPFTLCHDRSCAMVFNGNSSLPFDIHSAVTNLTLLTPLAGAGDWQGPGGTAQQNGYVPVTLDAANFTPRWLWAAPQNVMASNVVTTGGMLFNTNGANGNDNPVYGLNEIDASLVWSAGEVSAPLVEGNGILYARSASNQSFNAFRTIDGSTVFAQPVPLGEGSLASTPPVGGTIFYNLFAPINGSAQYFFQSARFDAASGVQQTMPACLTSAEQGPGFQAVLTPAVDSTGKAYFATNGGLLTVDFAGDGTCKLIASGSINSVPILTGANLDVVAAGSNTLYDFDTAGSAVKWSVATTVQQIAAANGVEYDGAFNQGTGEFEARSEADGHVLWSWSPPSRSESFYSNIIITQNLAFFSTHLRIYAVDLNTHVAVWTLDRGVTGLALSANGILYAQNGVVAAVNLH